MLKFLSFVFERELPNFLNYKMKAELSKFECHKIEIEKAKFPFGNECYLEKALNAKRSKIIKVEFKFFLRNDRIVKVGMLNGRES